MLRSWTEYRVRFSIAFRYFGYTFKILEICYFNYVTLTASTKLYFKMEADGLWLHSTQCRALIIVARITLLILVLQQGPALKTESCQFNLIVKYKITFKKLICT
jgi:hypothetical protein